MLLVNTFSKKEGMPMYTLSSSLSLVRQAELDALQARTVNAPARRLRVRTLVNRARTLARRGG